MTTITTDQYRALVARRMPERDLQSLVVSRATAHGWHVWHDNATNHRAACRQCGAPVSQARNRKGLPDLLMVRDRVVWAELKTERGTCTPEQRAFLDQLQAAGQEVHVLRPSDIGRLDDLLAVRS